MEDQSNSLDPTAQAEGAMLNGTVIMKQNTEPGDVCSNGEMGIISGSVKVPDDIEYPEHFTELQRSVKYMYFVKWDKIPNMIGIAVDYKIKNFNTF